MNLFLSEYIGAFIKWLITGCKNIYMNEYTGKNKHTHFINYISIKTENMLLGLTTIILLIFLMLIIFKLAY